MAGSLRVGAEPAPQRSEPRRVGLEKQMPWHPPDASGDQPLRLGPHRGDEQAPQRRHCTNGQGCAGADLGHARSHTRMLTKIRQPLEREDSWRPVGGLGARVGYSACVQDDRRPVEVVFDNPVADVEALIQEDAFDQAGGWLDAQGR